MTPSPLPHSALEVSQFLFLICCLLLFILRLHVLAWWLRVCFFAHVESSVRKLPRFYVS